MTENNEGIEIEESLNSIVFKINELVDDAVSEKRLVPIREAGELEVRGGYQLPFNRDILKATNAYEYSELKSALDELHQQYYALGKDRPYRNMPIFLGDKVTGITIRKNKAYRGYDIEGENAEKMMLLFETDNIPEAKDLIERLSSEGKGLLHLSMEVEELVSCVVCSVYVTEQSLLEYFRTLEISFSRVRYRWLTGTQYRARVTYMDGERKDMRWGVFIVSPPSPLSPRSILYPRPRKLRAKSLNDPMIATRITHIGKVKLREKDEIYLVK
ncbi:hypothetical protein VHA01S_030_00350 [Vibrio halioticoli NBRC 102217]|uniref:Uncharacterized protein n=1 Tax=Vibrio halioticoli NBRC 102217 TaxID=1219072 RepID=V5HLA2_9VIBR|nr:hypothetical protein [Vibrio halioticoli]GAD89960.1 hypothetical protein VHA01S_030_00350 [Vibrio halioticoli NBRC 102217]